MVFWFQTDKGEVAVTAVHSDSVNTEESSWIALMLKLLQSLCEKTGEENGVLLL